jgi:hypothetical protein
MLVFIMTVATMAAQSTAAKVEQLLEAQSAVSTFKDMAARLVAEQRQANTGVDPAFWQKLLLEIENQGGDQLREKLIPIYQKHYTEAELDYLIDFYTSDVGKSIQGKAALVQQEVSTAGMAWGDAVASQVLSQVQALDAEHFNAQIEGCEDFHEGEFLQVFGDGAEIILNRSGDTQVENYQGQAYHYKIKWMTPCRYQVTEVDSEGKTIDNPQVLTYNIYDIYEGGHKVITNIAGTNVYDKSDVYTVVKN